MGKIDDDGNEELVILTTANNGIRSVTSERRGFPRRWEDFLRD